MLEHQATQLKVPRPDACRAHVLPGFQRSDTCRHRGAARQRAQRARAHLVVDDRRELAGLSVDMLKSLGYAVDVAHSALEALGKVRSLETSQFPELLFSELIMPGGMNGFVPAREIRKQVPRIRILLTTGFASSSDGVNADEGVAFQIFKKPYRLAELSWPAVCEWRSTGQQEPVFDAARRGFTTAAVQACSQQPLPD